ncbi:MAG: MFS transporter [Bacteroidota bacterium]
MNNKFKKDAQFYKFCAYGFLKNLRFFEPFMLLFFMEKGLSFFEIGTLYSIREICINILNIPTGVIADALGRRRTMIYSFSSYIISFTIFFFSGSYALFVVAFIFYGFGDSFRSGTHKAMIFDYLRLNDWQDQKVYYYGYTRSWSQTGSAISSLVAAALVFVTGNYQMIFVFSIVPYLIDLLIMLSYPKELDGEIKKLNRKELAQKFKQVIGELIFSFKNKLVLKSISNLSIFSGYHKAVKDFLQPFIQTLAIGLPVFLMYNDKQRSALLVGIIYFFIYMLTAIGARKSGKVADWFKSIHKPLNLSLIIGFGVGVLSGLFFKFDYILISILFFIIIFVIENLRKPLGISYFSDLMNNDILATALSAESQAETLFAAILAPLLGFCADQFGLGNGMLAIAVILLLVSPLFMVGRIEKKS